MKTHLAKHTNKATMMLTGFACDNNPFKKGRAVSFEEFDKSDNKCQKCLNSYSYKKQRNEK